MTEYDNLVEALVGMAKITRPPLTLKAAKDNATKRQESIQHGICDLLEDAAVAIDDLMQKVKEREHERRPLATA